MRNFFSINCLFLLLFGCKNEVDMIKCKGLDGEPKYLYFKTENEGYLFSNKTYSDWDNVTDEQMKDPNFYPESTDEANIYKTIDGGKNWVKIDSILNYNYFDIATVFNNAVYILRSDEREDFKFNIEHFDVETEEVENLLNTKPVVSAIWNNENKIFFTNNRGSIKLYSLDKNQGLDSIGIENYALQGLSINNKSYVIFSSSETSYFGSVDKENKEIKLPIIPSCITKQDNNILIAGKTKTDNNEISLVSYNVNTKQSKTIKKFKGYSIVNNLQSNDKAIVGFIGNIKGFFVEYDLIYSLDKGNTWKIRTLDESNYVRPSCLIDNILYIYSGGARMQKIIIK